MSLKYKYYLILLVIILIGIFLRFNYLEQTPFQSHVVTDINIAKNIAEGNEFRLVGVTSSREVNGVQQNFGPLSYYLFALPLIFTKSPLGVVGLISLLSVLSCILCFKFGKEFFNEKVGLIAAAFYAVSPWAIFFSNIMTSPFLMPIFILAFIYSLFKVIIKNEDKYIILCLIFLAILLQLHLSALWLIFVMIISLILFKRKINVKYLTIGLLLAFLFFTPFIYHNLTNPDAGSVIGHMTGRDSGSFVSNVVESVGMPFVLAGTYFGKYVFGQDYIFNSGIADKVFLSTTAIIAICLLLGLLFLLYNGIKKQKKEYSLLIIWFVVPILLYLIFFQKNMSPHFYLILFPVQFLILGILFDHAHRKNKILTGLIVLILLVASITYSIGFFNYLDEKGGSTAIYKLTYKTHAEVVDFILDDAGDTSPNIYYIGASPETSYKYIFELHGAHPNYIKLNSYEDLRNVNGYFISERYWRYFWFNDNLAKNDSNILDNLDKTEIHNVEIFTLSNKE